MCLSWFSLEAITLAVTTSHAEVLYQQLPQSYALQASRITSYCSSRTLHLLIVYTVMWCTHNNVDRGMSCNDKVLAREGNTLCPSKWFTRTHQPKLGAVLHTAVLKRKKQLFHIHV